MPSPSNKDRKTIDASLSLMRQVIERYDFLEKNSRVLVAVSGGVDSLVLLSLLVKYNQKYNQHWEIHGVHINPQFPKWHVGPIKNHFEKTNIPYTIAKTNIHKQIANLTNKCYRCAHERRRKPIESRVDKLCGSFTISEFSADPILNTIIDLKAPHYSSSRSR